MRAQAENSDSTPTVVSVLSMIDVHSTGRDVHTGSVSTDGFMSLSVVLLIFAAV